MKHYPNHLKVVTDLAEEIIPPTRPRKIPSIPVLAEEIPKRARPKPDINSQGPPIEGPIEEIYQRCHQYIDEIRCSDDWNHEIAGKRRAKRFLTELFRRIMQKEEDERRNNLST